MSTRLRREETSESELGCDGVVGCLCDAVRPRRRSEPRPPAVANPKRSAARPAPRRGTAVRRQLERPELDADGAVVPVGQPPLKGLLEEARPSSRLEGFARRLWAALRLVVLSLTLGLALSGAVGAGVFGLYRLVLAAR